MKDLEIQKSAVNPNGQSQTQAHAARTGKNPGDQSMQTSPCKNLDPTSSMGVKKFEK